MAVKSSAAAQAQMGRIYTPHERHQSFGRIDARDDLDTVEVTPIGLRGDIPLLGIEADEDDTMYAMRHVRPGVEILGRDPELSMVDKTTGDLTSIGNTVAPLACGGEIYLIQFPDFVRRRGWTISEVGKRIVTAETNSTIFRNSGSLHLHAVLGLKRDEIDD